MPRAQLILCARNTFDLIYTTDVHKKSHSDLDLAVWSQRSKPTLNELIPATHLCMVPRDLAERDEEMRQLIGYAILNVKGRYAHYQRKGGEKRLHGQRALGFGGHIGFTDLVQTNELNGLVDLELTVTMATRRELGEELGLVDVPEETRHMGLLALRDAFVSRVHLGVVTELTYSSEDVIHLENSDGEIGMLEWSTAAELRKRVKEFESWSAALLPHLRD